MSRTPRPPKPPNPAAKALAEGKHRPRVVKPKKGKGSYARKPAAGEGDAPASE